jgi:glycosyltransferase involved in cell wall biosynthesis
VLFITANLNAGGAQRSLCNFLQAAAPGLDAEVCVARPSTSRYFLDRLRQSGVSVFRPTGPGEPFETAGALLDAYRGNLPPLICFWNADPGLKLVLTKLLAHVPVRLVDVSPGPAMYEEMAATAQFQRAIAFSKEAYYSRIDSLVVKYASGVAPARAHASNARVELIANGVPLPALSPSAGNSHRSQRLIVAGRIAPTKHFGALLDAMRPVWKRFPDCELHVAGQAEPRFHEYFEREWAGRAQHARGRIRFLGALPDFPRQVAAYDALMLASEQQGCPNSSLEALAAGVPVIANDDGGTEEQVLDGITGFLVPRLDPRLYAERAMRLLADAGARAALGANGRAHVARHFSMAAMRARYLALFSGLLAN